jgi:hypothetical protein
VQVIAVFRGKREDLKGFYSLEKGFSDFGSVLGSGDMLLGSLNDSLFTDEGSDAVSGSGATLVTSGSATISLVGSGLEISGSLVGSELGSELGSEVGSDEGSDTAEGSLEGSETVVGSGSATVGSGSAVVKGSPVGSGVVPTSLLTFLLVPKYKYLQNVGRL